MKIPRLTSPLAKSIRTAEGIAMWALDAALAAGTIIKPGMLPPEVAAILAVINHGLFTAHRTAIKYAAVLKEVGLTPETVTTSQVEKMASKVAQDIVHHLSPKSEVPPPNPQQGMTVLPSDAEEKAVQP